MRHLQKGKYKNIHLRFNTGNMKSGQMDSPNIFHHHHLHQQQHIYFNRGALEWREKIILTVQWLQWWKQQVQGSRQSAWFIYLPGFPNSLMCGLNPKKVKWSWEKRNYATRMSILCPAIAGLGELYLAVCQYKQKPQEQRNIPVSVEHNCFLMHHGVFFFVLIQRNKAIDSTTSELWPRRPNRVERSSDHVCHGIGVYVWSV